MCVVIVTFIHVMSERIPNLEDDSDYSRWKKAVKVWQLGTTAKKTQQASRLIGFMNGRAYEAALQIAPAELGDETGVDKLITELDSLFLKDATHNLFMAIEDFEHYKRPEGVAMDLYVRDFEQKRKKIDQLRGQEVYEDGVLAYKLLNQANLNPDQKRLVKATITKLDYKMMVQSLKQTFGDEVPFESPTRIETVIKEEPDILLTDQRSRHSSSASGETAPSEDEGVLYNSRGFRGKGKFRKYGNGNDNQTKQTYQNYQGCYICKNPNHRVANCPHNTYNNKTEGQRNTYRTEGPRNSYKTDGQRKRYTYLADMTSEVVLPERDEQYTYFIGETVNKGLLDTGASATVCGQKWLEVYTESLTGEEARKLKTKNSKTTFRFGDGESVVARKLVTLPVKMFGKNIVIRTHVVDTDIPLLLSKQTVNEHRFVIDIGKKKVYAHGGEEPILDTASGHMVVSIGRGEDSRDVPPHAQEMTFLVDVNDARKTAQHLHRYFAHGSAKKIGEWVKSSGVENSKEIIQELEQYEAKCEFCIKHKTREAPKRKVAIPSGNVFNEVIAMDLKKLSCGVWIIHIIDTVTRFTVAASLTTKTGKEIVQMIFKHWISIFGRPGTIISDNGGEFINTDFLEMCSMCSINFKTSPAASPWCNGMVERHHSMLSNMIDGVIEEQKPCNLEIAIGWSCNAKNSLNNVFGFTPYQLVFGRNPTVPSVMNQENLPSLNNKTASKIVADNLNALEEARRQFVKLENSEKLKKVLRERVFTRNNARYTSGDIVYYKKDKEFLGPAHVVGQQANSVLIKHGGALIRVNPCKVVLKQTADDQVDKLRAGVKDPYDKDDKDTDKETKEELTKTRSMRAGGIAVDKDDEDTDKDTKEELTKTRSMCAGGIAVDKEPRTKAKTRGTNGSGRIVGLQVGVEQRNVTRGIRRQGGSQLYGEIILSDCEESEGTEDPVVSNCEECEGTEEPVESDCEESGDAEDPVVQVLNETEDNTISRVGEENMPSVEPVKIEENWTSIEPEKVEENWTSVEPVKNGALNLKKDDIVRFRSQETEDWTNGLVTSRAGKSTGQYKNAYNLEIEDEEDALVVDLNGKTVERLMVLEDEEEDSEEELLFIEEDKYVFSVSKVFTEDPDVKEAKELELLKFREFGVYEEVRDVGQPSVSSRWIVTKSKEKVRARLVARGYEENYPRADAPTSNKTSLRLLFAIAASARWSLESLDVTAAFLQSDEMTREVYLKPPADIRKQGVMWRLKKPVYGLGDAARRWYITLSKYLTERGCIMSVLDKCVFRYVRNDKLHGIVLTHVDDLLYAGTPTFHREIIDRVRRDFKISRIHAGVFTYLGWNVKQDTEKGVIRIDQRGYGQSITTTELSIERKKQPESKLTEEEKKVYQKQLGRMLWLSGQTRPDLSFDTLELSTYSSNACVKHVKMLNKVTKKIAGGPKSLCFKGLDLQRDNISITFYTDASVGNTFTENGRQTQSGRGYLVFLTNGKTANLIDWSSRKIKRVVHSAFGAETLACIDAMGAAIYVRQILSEILYGDPKSEVIPIKGFADSKQLHDHVHTSKQCEEKRLRLDLAELQQALSNKTLKSLTWIPTDIMLADCLTKKDANCEQLCTVIERGEFLERD